MTTIAAHAMYVLNTGMCSLSTIMTSELRLMSPNKLADIKGLYVCNANLLKSHFNYYTPLSAASDRK